MARPLTTLALCAALAGGGCEAINEGHQQAIAREARAESLIQQYEAIQAPSELDLATLEGLRGYERQLEQARKAWDELTTEELTRRGLEAGGAAASGNWMTVLLSVSGAVGAAVTAWATATKQAKKSADLKLDEFEERLNRTLDTQGIAGLRASSSERATSPVAMAARKSSEQDQDEKLAKTAQRVFQGNQRDADAALAILRGAGLDTSFAHGKPTS